MIKIKPYTEITQKEEFFNLYLYMAANSMPFYPQDIFQEGVFYPDGKQIKDLKFYDRQPMRRTKDFKKILSDYKVEDGNTRSERKKSDAILAEKIIKQYSDKLHKFLYEGQSEGRVNPNRLRFLLTNPVGHDDLEALPFISDISKAVEKYRQDMLKYVFRYNTFSNQEGIYRLVSLLGVEVCPYCNRLYTTTIVEKGKQARPQIDHYRSKSFYPFLALSIMNLVPSCGVCNHIKGDDNKEVLYPYVEEMGELCTLEVDAISDITSLTGTHFNQDDLMLSFKKNGVKSPIMERAEASIDLFELDRFYQSHKGYVSKMLFQRYVFSDKMLKEIEENFSYLFHNAEEVQEMLDFDRLDSEHLGKHSLGKLTHDITKELDQLYKMNNHS